MKRVSFCLAASALLWSACSTMVPQDEIVINLQDKGAEVASSMYGIFFEEINHAGDGGLYAELIQNRGFEEHELPSGTMLREHKACAPTSPSYYGGHENNWYAHWDEEALKFKAWSVVSEKCDVTKDVITPSEPLHKNTPNAFKLGISNIETGGKVELINSGYWGIAVKENEKYDLRFYLFSRDYKGTVTANIYDTASGEVVASHTFEVNHSGKWVEYKAELIAGKTINKGEFRLEFTANGNLFVDYVSLFPRETFKNRPNGLRKDIAEFLAGMKPAFMRWPGGCIVEGATLENRVKWKETLGDPMTRRGEWVLWGYRSSWGMGYHEFLQFCEDLNMDAMFVANAGMSCSIRNGDYVSEAELEPFLQDIRDAIEYAIGNVKSEWGARRAAAGHPEPFPLKYVEIGNENSTDIYARHFNYLYSHLKKEYPDLTFINTMSWKEREIEMVEQTDMVDPHWYENPGFFFAANGLFDDKQRGKYTTYVGEYACNNGVGKGNMEAALSEAAFIMGMERNSDFVTMTSYAPLLCNDHQPNWKCNLIWFNNEQVVGRASYYVQKMFADHAPDYNLGISKSVGELQTKLIKTGTFGIGSWDTKVDFKDIKVTQHGEVRAIDPSQFEHKQGEWNVLPDGVISQTAIQAATRTLLKDFSSDEYTLELKVLKNEGREGFFIYYGMTEDGMNGYVFNVGLWGNTNVGVECFMDGSTAGILGTTKPISVQTGQWYDVKVEVTPLKATLYVDGKVALETLAETYPLHFFASGYDETAGEVIVKVVNANSKPYVAEFKLDGAAVIENTGKVISLKANSLGEENSFDEPYKIYPEVISYDKFGKNFNYEFSPFSYTVLRIKARY
ncbi:alpha-L-arabinofuranosidase C-terminal domain-containing protein [Bacteroides oleiciplenus]|uniref:non-reducing end alpha-L-arabinofuranosidase n=1 Tax=Bacteroides oleiciplenus YIT 12058 TaxID=742727 RepID=K9EPE0_9BACE|nr:alpha-L-arabinofuranosidase C-terminal domain-containing protein [Bacteroides oleiciplenus]EKU91050.1 hypothetical protein HMPREF9447_02468 [Bacteroides oleiciplenus YIT 12058]